MGEGGGFPAATRVVAEWLPAEQRSTGMGIINAGTAVGSVLAPPLIGLILWRGNWREVFFVSGGLGLLWAVWWLASFRGEEAGGVSRGRRGGGFDSVERVAAVAAGGGVGVGKISERFRLVLLFVLAAEVFV